jgi:predicted RNA-binding Zn-ribbon protein involved in translation (DUF1610 family)
MYEKLSKKMVCVYCGKGEKEDSHSAGWFVQWTCPECGRAQCHELEAEDKGQKQ